MMKFDGTPEGRLDKDLHVEDGDLWMPLYVRVRKDGGSTICVGDAYNFLRQFFTDLPEYEAGVEGPPKRYTAEELKDMGDVHLVGGNVDIQTLAFKFAGVSWTAEKIAKVATLLDGLAAGDQEPPPQGT